MFLLNFVYFLRLNKILMMVGCLILLKLVYDFFLIGVEIIEVFVLYLIFRNEDGDNVFKFDFR